MLHSMNSLEDSMNAVAVANVVAVGERGGGGRGGRERKRESGAS